MSLTSLIPVQYRALFFIASYAIAIAIGMVGGLRLEENVRDARDARQVKQQLQAQVAATTHTLAEEHRKTDAVQEIANETHVQAEHYAANAAAARTAGDRLRDQLVAAGACPRSAQPATAAGSAPAGPAPSVLADVQRRLAEAENATIEFADASQRAGHACERSYQAVTPQ